MTAQRLLLFALAIPTLCGACHARPPLNPASNSLPECQRVCSQVGLEMTSLVVVGDLVGCVCEVKRTETHSAGGAAASATAMIMAEQQQQQQQQAAAAAANKH
jgi:hypothetical protein